MTEPDDRELEQYLKGDSKLSRRYREASGETAPPELDEAILARARAEARRKPPSLNRYLAPVALAASVLLGVNLAWNLRQVEPVPSVPMEAPAEAPSLAKSAKPAFVPEPPAAAAPAPRALSETRARAPAPETDELQAVQATGSVAREESEAKKAEQRAVFAEQIEAQRRALKEKDEAGVAAPVVDSKPASAPAARAEAQTRTPLESSARAWSETNETLPAGWHLFGDAQLYDASTDEAIVHSAPNSLTVWRAGPGIERCGRLETEVSAQSLLGKSVRVRAFVRTQGASADTRTSLFVAFGRQGTIEPWRHQWFAATGGAWQQQEVAIEIPLTADRVVYGALLCGPGTLWIDDVELSIVTR